jgi:hypothetical protein
MAVLVDAEVVVVARVWYSKDCEDENRNDGEISGTWSVSTNVRSGRARIVGEGNSVVVVVVVVLVVGEGGGFEAFSGIGFISVLRLDFESAVLSSIIGGVNDVDDNSKTSPGVLDVNNEDGASGADDNVIIASLCIGCGS